MHIHYIWFSSYENFKSQQFQLDPKRLYSYDSETHTLTVSKRPGYVPNFFQPIFDKDSSQDATKADIQAFNKDNHGVISNITAIVGENGTGKSTFLNYIKNFLVKAQGRTNSHAIIVLEDSKGKVKVLTYLEDIDLFHVIDNDKLLPNAYIATSVESVNEFPDNSVIFYSNVFDLTYEDGLSNYYNVSTNYLVRQDIINRSEKGWSYSQLNPLNVHRDEDMTRQIMFVHDYQNYSSEQLGIRLPNALSISAKAFDLEEVRKPLGKYYELYMPFYDHIVLEKEKLRNLSKLKQINFITMSKELFKLNCCLAIFTSFLCELNLHLTDDYYLLRHTQPKQLAKQLTPPNRSISNGLIGFFKTLVVKATTENYPQDIEWLESLIETTHLLTSVDEKSILHFSLDSFNFTLPISMKNEEPGKSRHFIQLYKKSFRLYPYLDLSWRNLSSGEKSYLNFLSRLYTLSDDQLFGDNVKLSNKVLLLIDEGDLYFHPEWQRTYLHRLMKFLCLVYKGRDVQIILTTHSPFFLSDLPSTSVIYLERDEKHPYNTLVTHGDDSNQHQRTFAANIHTLLKDGFYMQSTFGDFAQHKLNNIITTLHKLDDTSASDDQLNKIGLTQEQLYSIINMVGEPVLHSQLLEMYHTTFKPSEEDKQRIKNQYEYWKQEYDKLGESGGNDD